MSLLSELKAVADACSIPVETGVFSGVPPDLYLVITPMADTFELHADNSPGYDTQEARLSLFVKGSYTATKDTLIRALLGTDFCITDRRYIGHEDDTGFHHYAIDVAKTCLLYTSKSPQKKSMAPLPPLWPLIGPSDAATTPASRSMTAEGCCLFNNAFSVEIDKFMLFTA